VGKVGVGVRLGEAGIVVRSADVAEVLKLGMGWEREEGSEKQEGGHNSFHGFPF
jgi:hypothetical protein